MKSLLVLPIIALLVTGVTLVSASPTHYEFHYRVTLSNADGITRTFITWPIESNKAWNWTITVVPGSTYNSTWAMDFQFYNTTTSPYYQAVDASYDSGTEVTVAVDDGSDSVNIPITNLTVQGAYDNATTTYSITTTGLTEGSTEVDPAPNYIVAGVSQYHTAILDIWIDTPSVTTAEQMNYLLWIVLSLVPIMLVLKLFKRFV